MFRPRNMNIHIRNIRFSSTRNSKNPFVGPKLPFSLFPPNPGNYHPRVNLNKQQAGVKRPYMSGRLTPWAPSYMAPALAPGLLRKYFRARDLVWFHTWMCLSVGPCAPIASRCNFGFVPHADLTHGPRPNPSQTQSMVRSPHMDGTSAWILDPGPKRFQMQLRVHSPS